MKTIDDILLLGDPRLYQVCEIIRKDELPLVEQWVDELHQAMEDIRKVYHFGRGIAAPQLGIMKRLIYINIDQPWVIINPMLEYLGDETMVLWDDCMSFPNLLVKVRRHQKVKLSYTDQSWEYREMILEDALSELIQHEYDHLNGVLATSRAIDNQSLRWRSPKNLTTS